MNQQRYYIRHLVRDIFIIVASIIIAVILARSGFIGSFVELTGSFKALSAFIAGAFFTSIFTVAPAGVALIAVAESFPPLYVAFFGALGAMCVDLFILAFIRKGIAADLRNLSKMAFKRQVIKAFHFGFFKWAAFIIGMFLIATPLPDEPGLFLLGISKINSRMLPLVFFLGHFLGIWAIVSIASAL